MKKEKKKKPTPENGPVVELDETTTPKGLSLQEMADALGAQMEQKHESDDETPVAPEAKKETAAVKSAAAAPVTDEETQKKLCELEDTVKQLVAENRNQKTRLENDFRMKLKYSNEGFFREFLLVKDDLEKALTFAPVDGDEKTTAFINGVRHLNSAIDAVLKRYCVEPFGAMGVPFDPNLHQAMRMIDVAGVPANQITAQYLKGWRYFDRVLRPAMVEVASGITPTAEKTGEEKPAEEQKEITIETTDTEESHG